MDVLEKRRTTQRIRSVGRPLAYDPEDLVFGNPEGDVTIVEFLITAAHGVSVRTM